MQESVQRKDAEFKQKCKTYADDRKRTKPSNIRIGDKVLVEQDKLNGLFPQAIHSGRKEGFNGDCLERRNNAVQEHVQVQTVETRRQQR